MNLRWRSPAAVMHRDFIVLFNSNSTITAEFLNNEINYISLSVYVANDQDANWDSGVVNVYIDDRQVAQVDARNNNYTRMIAGWPAPEPELVTLEVPQSDPDEAVFDGWYVNGEKVNSVKEWSFYPEQVLYNEKVMNVTARWISR